VTGALPLAPLTLPSPRWGEGDHFDERFGGRGLCGACARPKIAPMRLPSLSDGERRLGELLSAAQFFTRLPLGAALPPPPGALARAAWAFPIVGAVIGILCGVVYAIAAAFAFPLLAAALIAVAAGVLVTGGLHEDGLADTVDGLGGGRDRAEKLAIMRDSRSGAFAILALVFSVALRAAALSAIGVNGAVLAALIAAHAVGRAGLAAVMATSPTARLDGLGATAGRPDRTELGVALVIAVLIALMALGLRAGVGALALAACVMAAIAVLARRQVGGYTGDVLGAIEQGGETAMLLAAAAWAW
jgi:adenosylcobinamide-GDP ribazoletransferase